MYFNRFDICEAWYLALSECHEGMGSERYARLSAMDRYFTPSPTLTVDSLSDNGKVIYDTAIESMSVQASQND
jgi:hypothetical protein